MLAKIALTLSLLLAPAAGAEKTIKLTDANTVPIYGYFGHDDDTFLYALQYALLLRGKRDYPIYLVVHSPGGSVDNALQLLKELQGQKNVHTIALKAYSMGAYLIQGVEGTRYYTKDTKVLYHAIRHTITRWTADYLLRYAKQVYLAERAIDRYSFQRMGVTPKVYYENIKNDTKLDAAIIKKYNIADEQIKITCSRSAIKARAFYVSYKGAGLVSKCPLRLSKP